MRTKPRADGGAPPNGLPTETTLSPNIDPTPPTANDNRPRLGASSNSLPSHLDGTQYESSWNEPCVENVRNDSTLGIPSCT